MERRISEINDLLESSVRTRLYNDFGVNVTSLDISDIEINKDSDAYKELAKVTKDLTKDIKKAETKAAVRDIKSSQTLNMLGKAGKMFVNFKDEIKNGVNNIDLSNHVKNVTEEFGIIKNALGQKSTKENSVPPIPQLNKNYHLVVDGNDSGSMTFVQMRELKNKKIFTKDTLVWTEGMEKWEKAINVEEVAKEFFSAPEIPQ